MPRGYRRSFPADFKANLVVELLTGAQCMMLIEMGRNFPPCAFADVRERFGRSAAQNDLRDLVQEGRLDRESHGAYRLPYVEKRRVKPKEKAAIADYIVKEYCKPEATLGLDAGTSCTAVAEAIVKRRLHVHVFTSNLHAIQVLWKSDFIGTIRQKGGSIEPKYAAVYGPMMGEESEWGIDIAIVGVSGIGQLPHGTRTFGLSTWHTPQHPFKRWLADASKVIIPATGEKLGKREGTEFYEFTEKAPSGRIVIVTDSFGDEDDHRLIRGHAASIRRATGAAFILVNPEGEARDVLC